MQKETNKPATKASDIIPDQFQILFCEPTLLEGEDPNLFWDLVAAVIAERKPETASDWVAVSDLVTKLWEERLLRRASYALVRGQMIRNFGHYLAEGKPKPEAKSRSLVDEGFQKLGTRGYTQEEVEQLGQEHAAAAKRWLEGDSSEKPKKLEEINPVLARFGMTEVQLYAETSQKTAIACRCLSA